MTRNAFDLMRGPPMPPTETTDGKLTAAEREDVRRQLLQVEIAERLDHAQIARNLGCSPSLYSQLRNASYRGDADKYLIRARQWLAAREHTADVQPVGLVGTTIALAILRTCQRAWKYSAMARIVLPAGAGKTEALQHFKRTYGKRVVYLQAHQSGTTITGLLRAVARASGVKHSRNDTAGEIYDRVRETYAAWRANDAKLAPIILVDEATALNGRCLNFIRQFHDDPEIRAAVVLADTDNLDRELARGVRHLAGGYEQLTSRLSYCYPPRGLARADLVTADDVRAVAAAVLESLGLAGTRLIADTVKYLQRLACADGMYRNIVQRLRACAESAEDLACAPLFTPAQLDYAGSLLGASTEGVYKRPPFGADAPAEIELRRVG